jgi:hypothetical protein
MGYTRMYNCIDYTAMLGLSLIKRPKSDQTDRYLKEQVLGQEFSERSTSIFSAFCFATETSEGYGINEVLALAQPFK